MIKSNEATIEQMNEAIALFEGRKRAVVNERGKAHHFWSDPTATNPLYSETLHYHESWDELMPVVEKIETLEKGRFSVAIDRNYTTISDDTRKPHQREIVWIHKLPNNENNRLSRTYQAVYQFIQWYNNQTTSNE